MDLRDIEAAGDRLLARMQTPEHRAATDRALRATPAEMGRAAVDAAEFDAAMRALREDLERSGAAKLSDEELRAGAAVAARRAERANFRDAVRHLFPELGGVIPDLERYADSIVVRVLNRNNPGLVEQLLAQFGVERVQAIAVARARRLTNAAYRTWGRRLGLPPRSAAERLLHALWRR